MRSSASDYDTMMRYLYARGAVREDDIAVELGWDEERVAAVLPYISGIENCWSDSDGTKVWRLK